MSAKILEAVIPGLRGPAGADGGNGADGNLPAASNAENIAGLAVDKVTTPAADKAALDARVGPVEATVATLDAVPFAGFVKNAIIDMDFLAGRHFGERARSSLATAAAGTNFSRSSTAWAMGERRLFPIAAGQPRLTDRGLFIGDAATNLFGATNDFTGWAVASGATVASGTDLAPTGIAYTRVTANGSIAARYARSFTLALATVHVVAVPIKADTSTESAFFVAETGGGTNVVQLQWTWLSDGGFGYMHTQTGVAASDWRIDDLGNGDYLLTFRFTSHATEASHSFRYAPDRATGTQSAQIAPFTFVAGSMAGQPNRNATDAEDSLTQTVSPGTRFTFGERSYEVPLFAPEAGSSSTICTLDDGAANVLNSARIQYTSDRHFRLLINSAGVEVVSIETTDVALPGTRVRPFAVIEGNEVAFWCGDNLVGTATAASMPTFTRLCVGHAGLSGFRANAFLGGPFLGKGDDSAELARTAPVLKVNVGVGQSNRAGRGNLNDIDDNDEAYLAGPQNRRGNGYIFHAPSAHLADFATGAAFQRLFVTSSADTNQMNWSPFTNSFSHGQTGPDAALLFGRGERVLVKLAVDGTQMADDAAGAETIANWEWSSSVTGELFDFTVAGVQAALAKLRAAGYRPEVEWVDIDQGEADATVQARADAYYENFWNWRRDFREALATPTIKFAVTQLHKDSVGTYKGTIRTAQRNAVAGDPLSYLVDVDDIAIDTTDFLHFTAPNYHRRGFRVAAVQDAVG
jgi:hypothetical protein